MFKSEQEKDAKTVLCSAHTMSHLQPITNFLNLFLFFSLILAAFTTCTGITSIQQGQLDFKVSLRIRDDSESSGAVPKNNKKTSMYGECCTE